MSFRTAIEVYRDDGKNEILGNCWSEQNHKYSKFGLYTVKVFDSSSELFCLPNDCQVVHSIGNITDLFYMFEDADINTEIRNK